MERVEKKLLYICNRVFWPPLGGHEIEIYHYCRGLHEEMGYSIDVYLFEDKKEINIDEKPCFINNVFVSTPISLGQKIWNILTKSIIGADAWPIQCSLYYSKKNQRRLASIASIGYEVVFVDMIRLAQYYYSFSDIDIKRILDIDDLLSKRYLRQLNALDNNTVIAGQYNDKLPKVIQALLQFAWIKRRILNFEIPRMQKAEQRYSMLFDNVIFVSPVETEEFNQKYDIDKAVTVTMGVDYKFFSEPIVVGKEKGTASFVANMKTAANIDSVRIIINQILPYTKKLKRLYLIGSCSEELIEEFKGNPKVRFIGRVDDLRPFVKATDLFLSPLAYGSGIKTKILEAMAMGLPVVTNSIGSEGISGKNEIHWFVSDDPLQQAKYVDFLIDNNEARDQIGKNAQELIKSKYEWKFVFKQFKKLKI